LVLLVLTTTNLGAELKFLSSADGTALYRLKFDAIHAAMWRPLAEGTFPMPEFEAPDPEATTAALFGGAVIREVEVRDAEATRRRVKAAQAKLRDIERLKAKGLATLDSQQQSKVASEQDNRDLLALLEDELKLVDGKNRILFDIQTARGPHTAQFHIGVDNCRDVARCVCREQRLDTGLANLLGERMERKLLQRQQLQQAGGSASGCAANQNSCYDSETSTSTGAFIVGGGMMKVARRKHHGPEPSQVDLSDRDAVRRRVRALQKKLREIEKLRLSADGPECVRLDSLQKEKVAAESEVRSALENLERELDLLERPPRMVFDIETENGARQIEYRDGDDCAELARRFCEEHSLDEDLIGVLAEHMEEKLLDEFAQAVVD